MKVISKFAHRFLFAATTATLLLAGTNGIPANAQSSRATLAGTYNVSGTDTDGSAYTGTLAIKPSTGKPNLGTAYELDWSLGNTTDRGLGVLHDGVLSVAYGTDGCNLFVNKQNENGTGAFANIADQQFGTEQVSTSSAGPNGTFAETLNVQITNPDGTTSNGTATVNITGILSKWTWKIKDNPYGTGIFEPSTLTFAVAYQYKDTDKCGVVSYTVIPGAGTLAGIWARVGGSGLGSEVAVPSS